MPPFGVWLKMIFLYSKIRRRSCWPNFEFPRQFAHPSCFRSPCQPYVPLPRLLRQRRGVVDLLARGPEGRKEIAPIVRSGNRRNLKGFSAGPEGRYVWLCSRAANHGDCVGNAHWRLTSAGHSDLTIANRDSAFNPALTDRAT